MKLRVTNSFPLIVTLSPPSSILLTSVFPDQCLKPLSIELIEVELGGTGVATIRVKKQSGAVAYVHQYAMEPPGPNTMWHGEGSTTNKHTFNGLISDKRYWFRVVAVGRKGQKAYSPIVSRAIQ